MINELKPYPAMKDSGVSWLGKVPEHWTELPGKACFCEKSMSNLGMKETTVLSLSYGKIVIRPEEKLHGLVPASFETYQIVEPGDIVIRPTDLQNDWNSLRFALSQNHGIITSAYMCFQTSNALTREYGYSLLHTYDLKKVFYGLRSGLRQNLDWRDFKYLTCFVPPLPEQSAIVRFLDYTDRRIRRYIRAKKRLISVVGEERRRMTYEAARSAGTNILRLNVVADEINRPINFDEQQLYNPVGLMNWGRGIFHKKPIKGKDLGDSSFFELENGDLVISGQFAWEGATAIAGKEEQGCVVSHRFPILRGKAELVETGYLWAYFQTADGHLLLNENSRGAAGRNRPLNIRALLKEKIPVPPLPVQQQIANYILIEKRMIRAVAEMSRQLQEYRARLVADVVTGKLDVREAAANLPDDADVTAAAEEMEDISDTLEEETETETENELLSDPV